jgi:REP element-mobilizing transposase RayT
VRERTDAKTLEKTPLPISLPSIAAYFITFSCYGWHPPGQPGTVDRDHNVPGTRLQEPHPKLRQHWETSLKQAPFEMDREQRLIALHAMREVCRYKQWELVAAHVRSNHVHVVVDIGGNVSPELVMNALKSYASRTLNLYAPHTKGRLRWARHGSTRHLRSRDEIEAAVRYVLEKQGEPMACHYPSAP